MKCFRAGILPLERDPTTHPLRIAWSRFLLREQIPSNAELNWSAETERCTIQQYLDKMTRYLQLAGLESVATPDGS